MVDLNATLLALPALRDFTDAMIISSALLVGWNLFVSIGQEGAQCAS